MPCASSAVMRPRSTASFTTSSMRSRVSITRLSGLMTPFVIASRTSATDLPEKSSRSAAAPAAAPARWPVPAALPARRRAGVERVLVLREREVVERRLVPPLPEREVEDREDPDARDDDPEERAEDERELDEPEDREPPDEREPDERDDPDEEPRELEPLERLPFEDPPLLPPDDSAIFSSSCRREPRKCAPDYFMPAVQATHAWSDSRMTRPSPAGTSRTSSGNWCGGSTTPRPRSRRWSIAPPGVGGARPK